MEGSTVRIGVPSNPLPGLGFDLTWNFGRKRVYCDCRIPLLGKKLIATYRESETRTKLGVSTSDKPHHHFFRSFPSQITRLREVRRTPPPYSSR